MNFNHIVDRIAVLSTAIHEKASHTTHAKSHYADAMLYKPLAAYVREADVVESRMFVVPQPSPGEIPTAVDLARKETASATPLKKARDAPLALLEPEEYIRTVLRLGEKYKVMPRAQSYARELLQRTEELQRKIPELEREYKESAAKAGRGTPGSSRKKTRTLKEEERLTREAEARTATLREQRDILLKRLNANASATDSISTSDVSMFTSPSTIKASSHITAVNFLGGNESSTSAPSPPARPVPKRTTAQELQARRQARQAARQAQRMKSSNTPSRVVVTEEEKAFWSGGLASSPSTLFAGALHPQSDSGIDTSTTQSETETETEEGTPAFKVPEAQASDVDAETCDGDDDGDVTVVLEPKQQTQSRRTFSLLRQSTTRMTMTPGKLASNDLQTEPPPVPSLPSRPSPKTIIPPQPTPIFTSDTMSNDVAKAMDRGQIQEDSRKSGPPYALDVSSPEVELQMTRVWKTVGEILIPDNAYSKNNAGPGTEATLNILSAIANLPTKSEDPSGEKTSATMSLLNSHRARAVSAPSIVPSAIQVITAALILTLLQYVVNVSLDVVPGDDGYIWMPLNLLKGVLKTNPWAIEALSTEGVDWVMKTMLKAVPAKLIVIDRRKGTVRFGKE